MGEDASQRGSRKEDSLLSLLVEAIQALEAARYSRDHHRGRVGKRRPIGAEVELGSEEGMLSAPANGKESEEMGKESRSTKEECKEKECKQRVVGVLRELSVVHSDRVTAWREALTASACMVTCSPPGGDNQLHHALTGDSEPEVEIFSDPFINTFLGIVHDIENILDRLNTIIHKLDKEIITLCAEEVSVVDADKADKQRDNTALQETSDCQTLSLNSATLEDNSNASNSNDSLGSDYGPEQGVEDGQSHTKPSQSHTSLDTEKTSNSNSGSSECKDMAETRQGVEVRGQATDDPCISPETQTHSRGREEATGEDETNTEWVTVGLTGQLDSQSDVPDACYITAPVGVAKAMTCELVDTLSSLMVIGSEQLVSRVIKVKVQDGTNFQFPVTVIVPFRARYRGNYRDVAVKVVDGEKKASYITPLTTEGTYGGQRGSFAEVRVYSLGLFAVVSCLKRETYTVPRRGLSLKLPMDPRICLDYLPGSFTAPVITQSMVQPVDATLLASLKSRSDAYHSVVSTSPLLYLTHPSSQPLRRPLTLTLPCPPNPEKKRAGKREEPVHNIRPASASPLRDQATSHRVRMLSASVKSSKEISNELLVLLGSRDQQWNVLDKVAVRNLQNGLVSFELTENFERLLVVRLLSSGRPCPLTSLVEELEESICCHAVTIILQSRQEEPHAVLVAAVPSRDLSWELTKLRAQGYGGGLPETSSEISMREGDQLLLRFSGNVTATGTQNNHGAICERITFHSQRKNHLFLRLAEVDPFGNYSSAHYKGTAMFYKLTRGQREWTGDNMEILPDPVCTLALTLPKKVRTINRPISAKVKLYEETGPLSDSLLLWLSRELSEGELALLVLSLRLRRSTTQLVKLRARDSLSAQAFHLLALWRRGQPAAPHPAKASQLAHCLAKSGRPDLARELLLRQAAATRRGS